MLRTIDEALTALEKTAWRMRALSDEAVRGAGQASADAELWRARGRRLATTGWTLGRIAAEYRWYRIYSAFLPRAAARDRLDRLHARSARRVYQASVTQMGALLKVGQLLSSRRDLLPAVWTDELARLQDAVPAEPWERVRAVVEAELGPIGERFASFEEVPLAAASIGQVHRAVTRDGDRVAVKVQRPDVAAHVAHDLHLLGLFLEATRGILPPVDHETIAAEVRTQVLAELDYRDEARALTRAAEHLVALPGVIVPRPLPSLSGERVLTMPLVEGEKITTALDRAQAAGDHALVARVLGTLLESYLRQVFELGVFQADPHPGNFLVTDGGDLVLLDFGCTRALTDEMRRGYRALLRAFVLGDDATLVRELDALGFRTASGRPDTLLAFAAALLDVFRGGVQGGQLRWPTREQLYAQGAALVEASQRDPVVRLPPEFVMIARVFGTVGGLFQHYQPALDFTRLLPYLA